MKTFRLTGNLAYTPTDNSPLATDPLNVIISYTQKVEIDLTRTSTVASEAIPLSGMTAPKGLVIECVTGSFTIKLDSGDTGTLGFSMGATPVSTDRSILVWTNPTGAALSLTLAVPTSCTGRVWIFQ